jgi:pimeloyl-ACP methyl ester carboxylesterase
LVLFHSTAYPDSEEKKESRNKVIDFIKKNGVKAFTSNFITSLFADPHHPAIELVRAISMEATEQAVISYTMAMRDRPDSTESLKNFRKPVLFVGGEKDAGISPDSLHKQASSTSHAEVFILKETAHMGMFETVDQTLQKIHAFISEN